MAKRRYKRRKKEPLDYLTIPEVNLSSEIKRGILVVLIFTFGAVSLLGFFDLAGAVGDHLDGSLTFLFGLGKWLMPIILFQFGFFLYNNTFVRGANYLGLFLFVISFQALLYLLINTGGGAVESGGGYAGLFLGGTFLKLMGFWASLIVVIGLWLISLMLIFNTTLAKLLGRESWLAKLLYHPFSFIFGRF